MKRYLIIVVIALSSLLIFWMPFLFKIETFWGINFGNHGMETIVSNFDGLNYLSVAKTMYNSQPIYFASHFPLYPLLIRGLDVFMTGPQALLGSIIISNILLAIGLYMFFRVYVKNQKLVAILTTMALFFPARILSVRGVGTSEPLFIFFILTSLAMAYQGKHWWASILGSLAVLTRSPGIFLFGAYTLALWRKPKDFTPYLLMPMALVLLFTFYEQKFGSFWAYFNSSSELHPIFFPPFLIFSNTAKWITDMWREDIIYIYLFYGLGLSLVKEKTLKIFGFIVGTLLLLTAHRDLARYALPIAPIALLGFAPVLNNKYVKWGLLLLVPIYLLGWQFVVGNVQPISDWSSLI